MNPITQKNAAPMLQAQAFDGAASDLKLSDITRVMRRRWILIVLVLGAATTITLAVSLLMHKHWKTTAQLVLIQHPQTHETTNNEVVYAQPTLSSIETHMGLIQSEAMFGRTLNLMRMDATNQNRSISDTTYTPKQLEGMITIDNPKDSNILNVSAEAGSPQEAKRVADTYCRAYVAWQRDCARQQIHQIALGLQARAVRQRTAMLNAEQRVQRFKEQQGFSDSAAQDKAINDSFYANRQEAALLQEQIHSLQAKLGAQQAQLAADRVSIQTGLSVRDDALVASLQQQLGELEMERAADAMKYKTTYPGLFKQEDDKIRAVKARLANMVHGILDLNKPSLQSQATVYEDYKQNRVTMLYLNAQLGANAEVGRRLAKQSAALPKLDSRYAQLVQSADLASNLYSLIQQKLNTALLDQDKALSDVQLAQLAPIPLDPSRPKLGLNLALGVLLGGFMALLAVIIAEQHDPRLHDAQEAAMLVPAPIIGEFPRLSSQHLRHLAEMGSAPQLDMASALVCGNLASLTQEANQVEMFQHQVILVTSALPGEGKSLAAQQLARNLAALGRQTLLVEVGLAPSNLKRRPMPIEDLNKTLRLYTWPSSHNARLPLAEAAVASETPNLSLLRVREVTALTPEAPLIPQLIEAIRTLRGQMDVIVVDSPACMAAADALFLASCADTVIQVVGIGRAEKADTLRAFHSLSAARPRLYVVLLNHVSGYKRRRGLPKVPLGLDHASETVRGTDKIDSLNKVAFEHSSIEAPQVDRQRNPNK